MGCAIQENVHEGRRVMKKLFSLILIVVAMVFSGTINAEEKKVEPKNKAAESIKKMGGFARRIAQGSKDWEVEFHLRGKDLDDKGLAKVVELKSIVSLNLRGTKITDKGLSHLSKLKRLKRLHLEKTQVGDKGIEHLKDLTELEYLNLYSTKITDKALSSLNNLKKLKRLYVWQTKVTKDGAEKLKKALPKLEVILGIDLSKLPTYEKVKKEKLKPKTTLKWIPITETDSVPKSINGLNTQIFFENKSGEPVKLVWKGYNGQLRFYALLKPGDKRQQNSYSKNTWIITDLNDKPYGYFMVKEEISTAVVPKLKKK